MKNNRNTAYHGLHSNPSLNSLTFQPICDETRINIIDKLKSKNIQRYMMVSQVNLLN